MSKRNETKRNETKRKVRKEARKVETATPTERRKIRARDKGKLVEEDARFFLCRR